MMKKAIAMALGIFASTNGFTMQQIQEEGSPMSMIQVQLKERYLGSELNLVGELSGQMGSANVKLLRFQKAVRSDINLGGEHVSLVIDRHGKLKGMSRMLTSLVADNKRSLPSVADSEQIAREFIRQHAADLYSNIKIQWVKPHDEQISFQANTVTLTGMKVKCRDSVSGLYFWVIVAADRSVMVFERDIEWNFFQGGRETQKWLHDSWLAEQGATFSASVR